MKERPNCDVVTKLRETSQRPSHLWHRAIISEYLTIHFFRGFHFRVAKQ